MAVNNNASPKTHNFAHMEHIQLSDIAPQTIGDERITNPSLCADSVLSVINLLVDDTPLPELTSLAHLSGATFTGDVMVSASGLGLADDTSKVKNFDFQGGYVEGSCGKYTREKNKSGSDDYMIRDGNWKPDPAKSTKYWFEPHCAGAKCFCILSAWNEDFGDG